MLVSGGQILAIDQVNVDNNTVFGDGVAQPLKVNTDVIATNSGVSAAITSATTIINNNISALSATTNVLSANLSTVSSNLSTVSSNLSTVSSNLSTVSSNLSTVSAKVDDIDKDVDELFDSVNDLYVSADALTDALDTETEERIAADEALSAAIDAKQVNLSAGDNISLQHDVISVSGTKQLNAHYPLFGVETYDGLVLGIKDATKLFYHKFVAKSITEPLIEQRIYADGYTLRANQFTIHKNITAANLSFAYTIDGNFIPDYDYEAILTVKDKDNNEVYVDYHTLNNKNTYNFSINVANGSPFTFELAGDVESFTGLSAVLSCYGTSCPDYSYLDDMEVDADESSANQILVWNPSVLGVKEQTDDVVGVNDDTALGV